MSHSNLVFNPSVQPDTKTKTMKTLVKTNRSLLPQIPSVFDDLLMGEIFNWPFGRLTGSSTTPSVNVRETEKEYEMEVAAPGFDKSNFKVELDNDNLVISAQRENNTAEKNKKGEYTRREFSCESFSRSFQLPERMVEKDKISAKYENGILHLVIPKSVEVAVNPGRLIEIQ